MEKEITILQSKRKILFLITYNGILIVIAVLMYLFSELLYFNVLTIIARIMAGIFVFVFGYNLVTLFLQYKNPKILIEVNKDGISDHTTLSVFDFIPWKNIKSIQLLNKEFETKKGNVNKAYIGIELNKMDGESDEIKIKIENNLNFLNVPVIIDIEDSDYDTQTLYQLLEEYISAATC